MAYNAFWGKNGSTQGQTPLLWEKDGGYSAWYATPQGQNALAAQQNLIRESISGWPRRSRNVLEINCGSGHFLEGFFEAGFDVTGHEANPALAALAKERLGQRAHIAVGNAELLPYNSSEFSYVVCLHCAENTAGEWQAAAAVLREAVRLAECGILLGFYSKASLAGMLDISLLRRQRALGWTSPVTILRFLRVLRQEIPGCKITWRSTLLTPRRAWGSSRLGWLSQCAVPFLGGAFVLAGVTFPPERGTIGLPLAV